MRGRPTNGRRKSPPPCTPEHRANLSAAKTGHVCSASTRAAIAARHRGRVVSEEQRARISATLTGRKGPARSVETRQKIAAAKRGVPKSADHRAKLAAANLGKTQSAETIAKRVEQLRGRTHTVAARAKMSVAVKRAQEEGRLPVPVSRRYTSLAKELHAQLAATGLSLEPEVRFGRYTVDLYDRVHHVAYEADGRYWHELNERRKPGYHAQRDGYLQNVHGLRVVRFSDAQIAAGVSSCAA